jgi:hypothetical protein
VLYDDKTAFPGYAAALPVLGSAAIIAGGRATPLLGTWPFQQIGKYSYSWYLWHWPVLMIGPAALGVEPSLKVNLVLAAGSLLLAIGSYHLVENPARAHAWVKALPRRGLATGLSLSATAAAFALITGLFPPALETGSATVETASAVVSTTDPEAELSKIIADSVHVKNLPENVTPGIEKAAADQPVIYADHCHIDYEHTAADTDCAYGDPDGTQTIFLLGDSHGAHWFPAVDAIAKKHHWRLLSRTKSACQAPSVLIWQGVFKRPYDECVTWRNQVFDEIAKVKPLLVVMSSNGGDSGGIVDHSGKRIDVGTGKDPMWARAWDQTFRTIGRGSPATKMVMIEDTPWPKGSAPECAATHPTKLTACSRSVVKAIAEPARRHLVAVAAKADGVTVVDPTPWFCTATCPVVVGNILVWKDNSHISTAYSTMLAPLLDAKLPVR